MRLLPRSLKWRTRLLTLLGLAGVIGTALYVWWRPITGFVSQRVATVEFWNDPDPLTRGLARGEFREGSPVDELIAAHPPQHTIVYDRYTQLDYPNGVTVLARDGRLVYATHLVERATFFNSLGDRELWGYFCGYSNHLDTEARLQEEQDRWDRFYDHDPHIAVAGVAGNASTSDWLRERAGLPRTNLRTP